MVYLGEIICLVVAGNTQDIFHVFLMCFSSVQVFSEAGRMAAQPSGYQ